MRTQRWVMAGLAGMMVVLIGPQAWAQGSLTPPGVPEPTMLTLAQVEPRTPITNAPYTITQPGSYYLTRNLSTTGHGIIIQADRVTLDLMGFSLTGDHSGGDYGIWLDGATNAFLHEIVLHGGTVSRFGYGIRGEYVQNSRMAGLAIISNVNDGVYLHGSSGRCDLNTIVDCVTSGNGQYGVNLSGTSGQCDANTIARCVISGNGSYGVNLGGASGKCDGNTVAHCVISGNKSFGINLTGNVGQCEGNVVAHCVFQGNVNNGIYVTAASRNRIENNHVAGTSGAGAYGIHTMASSANLILQNSCVGQTNNYSISATDTYGPIVTNSGALATTNGAAALSPWANFSR